MTAYSCVDYDRSTPLTSRIYLNVKWPMRRRGKKDVQGSGPDTEREVGLCSVVAVGTTIADRPPHRSVRARLRIRLLLRMNGVEAVIRMGMQDAG